MYTRNEIRKYTGSVIGNWKGGFVAVVFTHDSGDWTVQTA